MPSPWVSTATRAFETSLHQLVGSDRPSIDPAALGRHAALEAVAGELWTDHLGPFYDTEAVQDLLGGVSRQAVSDRVRRHRIVALRTGSGRLVYPTFQFERRSVVAGLGEVLAVIAPNDEEMWFAVSWLVTPDPGLGSISPVEALRSGRRQIVIEAARDVAASLRG